MSGIFGISQLPVSTLHTAISPEGPGKMPVFIPEVLNKYTQDEFIPTNALKAKKHHFLKAFLSKVSRAARHV